MATAQEPFTATLDDPSIKLTQSNGTFIANDFDHAANLEWQGRGNLADASIS